MQNSSARKSSRCGAISRMSADSAFAARPAGFSRAARSRALSAESDASRNPRNAASSRARPSRSWISAKDRPWASFSIGRHSLGSGSPASCETLRWIPAFAGMTGSPLALKVLQLVLHVLPLVGVPGRGLHVGDDRPDSGELGVQRGELLLLLGHVFLGQDRVHRALGDAHGAIEAFIRVDHQHVRPLVEAVDGADIDAVGVLALDAALGDDVSHRESLGWPARPLRGERGNYKATVRRLESAQAGCDHIDW